MKHFLKIHNDFDVNTLMKEALELKKDSFRFENIGKMKTLVMLFFNSSLRTRLSTEKAARNLGMEVIILNVNDAWNLEFEDGTIMNLDKAEHVKEAAQVISQYGDIIGIRAFPTLTDKNLDESEFILKGFVKNASIPVINLESATAHPLQSLADAITIEENKTNKKPKVVLSWAPHIKALPHAVPNSFISMMRNLEVDLTITHPEGYELDDRITKDMSITHDQNQALKDADFVYVKNWSSYKKYGKVMNQDSAWMMTKEKLGAAKFMHCLPVRRNVVVEDAVLDSENSLVIDQANNRTFAAQAVLKNILENL